MKRLLETDILAWKDARRRKPLVVRGARQVGKTWLVENVLAPRFTNCVTVDLEARRDLHVCFEGDLSPGEVLKGLELSLGRITPGETLLFLDEIQACPRAIMALRYFYEKMPELHVVAAGSLLEFAFADISVPVGRLQYLYVHPLTFYEYLLAIGKDAMAEKALSFDADLTDAAQASILSELKKYFFVGGMPEAVTAYRDTNSLLEVFAIHSEILDSYRDDFSKYTPKVNPLCLDAVLLNAAKFVGNQLKYSRLSSGFSYQTAHKAFDLLVKARLLRRIQACNPSGLPLGATANPKKFKASFLDIGLMQSLCQVQTDIEMRQEDLLAIYRGRLAEQFVAQELLAWGKRELFYWSRDARNSNAEIDFLVAGNGVIHPVEVKSGPAGKLRSMHMILKDYPNCPSGFVLYSGKYSRLPEQRICFLPLYAVPYVAEVPPRLHIEEDFKPLTRLTYTNGTNVWRSNAARQTIRSFKFNMGGIAVHVERRDIVFSPVSVG